MTVASASDGRREPITLNLYEPSTHHQMAGITVPRALPVTGIELLVPDVTGDDYVFIEANERPGLANHEPQPTAAAFVDFLFPHRPAPPQPWTPEESQ